ncbi:MAG: RluA family pseudouridine synthase [Clostridiales bacterium]|nr:RluA family pseudouridine synthase [Candidatus Apopatousia equi]
MENIVYEDNHIIVVVKPQNIPSQPDESGDKDMLTMVKEYIKEKYNKSGEAYVGLVHRLDRPTGGLMVFAKTSKAASRLTEQMKSGEFDKKYLACLVGKPKYETDRLIHYLKKDEINNVVKVVPMLETGAKKAELQYKIVDYNDKLSLAEIKLFTGRSHQIRVQMSTIGNPVFGDVKYHGDIVKGYNLALWAYKLVFTHPVSKKTMNFICYPEEDETPWSYFKNFATKL